MAEALRHALIVGASRGLGLGLVETFLKRGWRVTATRRTPSPELETLASETLAIETADIDDDASICALHERLAGQSFDLVFVVAGILSHRDDPLHDVPREAAAQVYLTNAVSPIRFAEAFSDLVAPGGTIAFMSSILGSVALNDSGGTEIYRASKAALNSYARSFAARHAGDGFGVLVLHPGWVRTEMGGEDADIDVATSAAGMAEVIEARLGEKDTAFFDYSGKTLPW